MSTVPTLAGLAPPVSASLMMQLLSLVRNGVVMLTYDNPLVWAFARGRRNAQADFEGPFYMMGAPSRQIADGGAVLASKALLNQFSPFLFTFSVKDAKGDPVPHARFEWWQADSDGAYYFSTYTLRGTFTADENGCAEAVSVRPGAYGPATFKRMGHVHLMVTDDRGKCEALTTQAYVCPRNDASTMDKDFVNMLRRMREGNMIRARSVPNAEGGEAFFGLPELEAEDEDMWRKVEWWNGRLGEEGVEKKIVAVGHVDFVLNQA